MISQEELEKRIAKLKCDLESLVAVKQGDAWSSWLWRVTELLERDLEAIEEIAKQKLDSRAKSIEQLKYEATILETAAGLFYPNSAAYDSIAEFAKHKKKVAETFLKEQGYGRFEGLCLIQEKRIKQLEAELAEIRANATTEKGN